MQIWRPLFIFLLLAHVKQGIAMEAEDPVILCV
jgi:hypothetical protein